MECRVTRGRNKCRVEKIKWLKARELNRILLVTECRLELPKFEDECRVEIRAGMIRIRGTRLELGKVARLLETQRRGRAEQLFRPSVDGDVNFSSIPSRRIAATRAWSTVTMDRVWAVAAGSVKGESGSTARTIFGTAPSSITTFEFVHGSHSSLVGRIPDARRLGDVLLFK
jgi:hypothetical protein